MDGVTREFEEGAIEAIATLAIERKTGARGLRAIIEDIMMDIMYDIPSRDDVAKVTVTRGTVEKTAAPIITPKA